MKRAVPLREHLATVKQKARKLGLPNRAFDQKRFADEMWDR